MKRLASRAMYVWIVLGNLLIVPAALMGVGP